MKKYVTLTLFIFWTICTAIITAGLLSYASKNQCTSQSTVALGSSSPTGQNSSPITLTAAEVAKHNSANDCWMIIGGRVYNVTSTINSHPGGSRAILKYCGQDGTVGFQTKDYGPNHSSTAYSLLSNYLIGNLNQTISGRNLQNTIQQQNNTAIPPGLGSDREND